LPASEVKSKRSKGAELNLKKILIFDFLLLTSRFSVSGSFFTEEPRNKN
jgi:hypothetical protein